MRKKLRKILHQYKVDAFRFTRDQNSLEEVTREALTFSEDALKNAYHFHFHKLPDADRAEIINMINNYTVEAILPPVIEKVCSRIVILERQHERLLAMIERLIEELDQD